MFKEARPALTPPTPQKVRIGSLGHLSTFLLALGTVLLPPLERGIFPALFMVGVLILMYPFALKPLVRLRWVFILGSLFLVNVFFGFPADGADRPVMGLSLSSTAMLNGAQMTLRAIIILLAADGLSSSVNITEMAGLLERGGLRGLGFSIGVATNLLPDLRQSSINAWHSLRMRGGLRAHWFRGVQLLILTVLSNALRHAEEIVFAAEVRAFHPAISRKVSIRKGTLDWWIVAGEVTLLVMFIFL